MFQTGIKATLELQVADTLARLKVITVIITGALCLLCAAIFLLHQWLPWWQAFGSAGLATLLAGTAISATAKRSIQV